MDAPIQSHNQKPATVWSSGGSAYDTISRGIADSIEHCVLRLGPKQGERILDLATGPDGPPGLSHAAALK